MIRVAHALIWPTIPLRARLVKARCRRVEDVVVMRRAAIEVRDLAGCLIAATLSTELSATTRSDSIAYAPDAGAAYLLHDGADYWRPMEGFKGRHVMVDDLPDVVRRLQSYGTWGDWPFVLPRRDLADGKIPIHEEGELLARRWETDLDLEQSRQAEAWRDDVGVLDGALYRRCIEEPRIEVRADGLIHEAFRSVRIVPRAIATEEEAARGKENVLQVFRPDRHDDALAYAKRVAEVVRKSQVLAAWKWDLAPGLPPFRRPEDLPTLALDAGRRFAARTEAIVGKLDRENAIRWLDLRESVGAETIGEDAAWDVFLAMQALYDSCVERDPRTARTIRFHSAMELLRVEDGGRPRPPKAPEPELSDDDLAALEGL